MTNVKQIEGKDWSKDKKVEYIPCNDRVLLEPYTVDSFSPGGIMTAGGSEDVLHAVVLAVGKGRLMPQGRMAIDVQVGDKVIYGNMANNVEDKLNGKRVLLVVEQCIIAVIKD
ncbi:MAG: hypothetical protein V3T88_00160 [Nitrosomonadaceae bacterium]